MQLHAFHMSSGLLYFEAGSVSFLDALELFAVRRTSLVGRVCCENALTPDVNGVEFSKALVDVYVRHLVGVCFFLSFEDQSSLGQLRKSYCVWGEGFFSRSEGLGLSCGREREKYRRSVNWRVTCCGVIRWCCSVAFH